MAAPAAFLKYAREVSVGVGTTNVPLLVDGVAAAGQAERERHGDPFKARNDTDKMQLSLKRGWSGAAVCQSWQDEPAQPLERQLREIAAAIIVCGEQMLRDAVMGAHAWRIEHKAELEANERRRKTEEERQRRIRQTKREQARVSHLLGQAQALEQARLIRAYVDAVREANGMAPDPMSTAELGAWTIWALEQAARIDPVLSNSFKSRPLEPDE